MTKDEEAKLLEMLASGAKAPAIARTLGRSTGAIYVRINSLRRARRRSLPSERITALRSAASTGNRANDVT
jgi:hypothetical protein